MEPDLSAALEWLAARDATERKRRGQWPTPWWLCQAVAEAIAPSLGEQPFVVDPACGDGRWLLAIHRVRPKARLLGIDSDPLAIEAARRTLETAGVAGVLRCADGLAEEVVPACDWVVGNPPFVRPQHLGREVATRLWARYPLATDKVDLSACFVARALEVAPCAALVLPQNVLSLTSYAALRGALLAAGVDGVYSVPARAFGATVDAVVVVVGRSDRRLVGRCVPGGLKPTGRLAVTKEAWSLAGPMPELPGRPLGDYVKVHMGIVCGDYPRYVHHGQSHEDDRLTCRGRDVGRFEISCRDEWVRYDPADMLMRKPYVAPKHAGLFDLPEKVVLAGTTGTTLRAAVDTGRRFPLDSCYVVLPSVSGVDAHGIAGLLLSRQAGDWYGARFRAARVKGVEVVRIPVPPPPWTDIAAAARARDDVALNEAVDRAYGV